MQKLPGMLPGSVAHHFGIIRFLLSGQMGCHNPGMTHEIMAGLGAASHSVPARTGMEEVARVIRGWLIQEALTSSDVSEKSSPSAKGSRGREWNKLAAQKIKLDGGKSGKTRFHVSEFFDFGEKGTDDKKSLISACKEAAAIFDSDVERQTNLGIPGISGMNIILCSISGKVLKDIIETRLEDYVPEWKRTYSRRPEDSDINHEDNTETDFEVPLAYLSVSPKGRDGSILGDVETKLDLNPILVFLKKLLDEECESGESLCNAIQDTVDSGVNDLARKEAEDAFFALLRKHGGIGRILAHDDALTTLRTTFSEFAKSYLLLTPEFLDTLQSLKGKKALHTVPAIFFYDTNGKTFGACVRVTFMPQYTAMSLYQLLGASGGKKAIPMSRPLAAYMGVGDQKPRRNVLENIDQRDQGHLIERMTVVANLPPARWPASHSLNRMQQFAINALIPSAHNTDPDPIVAVNGPPGTGKTTLLRDVVADVVYRRAEYLAKIADPYNPEASGFRWAEMARYSAVLVSSNNGAIENITRELPLAKHIAGPIPDFEYLWGDVLEGDTFMRRAASRLIPDEDDGRKPDAWGLIVGELGRLSNLERMEYVLLGDREEGGSKGEIGDIIQRRAALGKSEGDNPLARANDPEVLAWWEERKAEFHAAVEEFCQLAGIDTGLDVGTDAVAQIADTEVPRLMAMIEKQKYVRGQRLKELNAALKKPRPSALLFWRRREYDRRLAILQDVVDQITQNLEATNTRLIDAKSDLAHRKGRIMAPTVSADNGNAPSGGGGSDFDASSLEAYFQNGVGGDKEKALNDLRRKVFWASYKLSHAFAYLHLQKVANAAIKQKNRGGQDWNSIFLLFPVVSTTFASFTGQAFLDEEETAPIGTAMIDEAGQATPQIAINLLSQSSRAIIVGDPLQCEPIPPMGEIASRLVMALVGVSCPGQWLAPSQSVQTLADRASSIFASVGEREVGIPLLIHHRCPRPIFEAINSAVYGGIMYPGNGKPPEWVFDRKGKRTVWVTPGKEENGAYNAVRREIRDIIFALEDHKAPPKEITVFIISPFAATAAAADSAFWNRRTCNGADALTDGAGSVSDRDTIRRVCNKVRINIEIGTIHSFQGKQAEVVFLLLPNQEKKTFRKPNSRNGRVDWATGTVNLINVAATRATASFVVIGDRSVWGRNYFQKVVEKIDQMICGL